MPGSCGSTSTRRAKLPGVLDIVTGADLAADRLERRAGDVVLQGRRRQLAARAVSRRASRTDRVRFVGEPVALVVAETEHIAQDAAEADRDRIRGPAGLRRGAATRSPTARCRCTRSVPDNLAFDYEYGDQQARRAGLCRRPRMSCASSFTRSGFPATRWSRSPASPLMTRRTSTFDVCVPTQGAARSERRAGRHHRACAARNSASAPRTSAAASACATRSIRNSSP